MTKSKKEIIKDDTIVVNENLPSVIDSDDSNIEQCSNIKTPLMPELEELVKNNPNRLIGCGG